MFFANKDTPINIGYDTLCCFVDDFLKGFEPWYRKQLISSDSIKRNRSCQLSLLEIITILIAYHQSWMFCFKYSYQELCKLIGDKSYISKKLFSKLFDNGITLITKIKKNMKNCLMDITD